MSDHLWALGHLVLAEQRRQLDFRRARVCRTCRGRGKRLWWRGFRPCRVCHGRGMLGG